MSSRSYLAFVSLLLLCTRVTQSVEQRSTPDVFSSWDSLLTSHYFSNEEIEGFMKSFTASEECGSISRMFSVGKSVKGVDLWVLEVALHPGAAEAKPNFKYVANMHGDETSGRQLLLKLAYWLCTNRNRDPRAKAIVEGAHLFLMPTMNPDGFAELKRSNAQHIDLNRNFPDRFEAEDEILHPMGDEAPETLAMMKWIEEGFFVASGNLHEGALVANYPWDADKFGTEEYSTCPDDATFIYMAQTYAKAHSTMHKSEEFPGGITNGNAWYSVYGSMQDFNYIMGNCLDLTLELSDKKNPSAALLESLWEENKNAFLNHIIISCFRGFRGTVVGEEGEPLEATISVEGINKDVHTRPAIGDFYRPLSPGTYAVTVSAAGGYKSFKTTIAIPRNRESRVYRIQLHRTISSSQFRTIQINAGTSVQPQQSWMPFMTFSIVSAVFLVIGILQVRKMSVVRRTA